METLKPTDVMMSDWNVIVIIHQGAKIEKFLGYWHQKNTYRISSQIDSYDPKTNTGKTLSGSRYQFLDKPGILHPKAQGIFDMLEKSDDVAVSLKYPTGGQ